MDVNEVTFVEREQHRTTREWLRYLVSGDTDRRIAIGLVVIVAILAAARMAPGVTGVYHDDGIYVATAKALAEGHGYRLIDLPGEPPQTKYPILYPLGLAVFWRAWPAFPQNLVFMQAFSGICTGLGLALGYLYLVRIARFSRAVAGTAALMCATSPLVLYFATQTLSESLFAFVTVVMLLAAENTMRVANRSRMGDSLRGVLIAAPILVRLIGVPLVGAIVLVLALKPRRHAWVLVSILATAACWPMWVLLQSQAPAPPGVVDYYTVQNYSTWWRNEPADIGNLLRLNFLVAMHGTGTIPFQWLGGHGSSVAAIALGVMAWLMIARHLRDRRVLTLSALAYLGLMMLWPWPPTRFLVPVALFITVWVVSLAEKGAKLLPVRVQLPVLALLAIAVVGSNLVAVSADITMVRATGYPQPKSTQPVFWRDYEDTFDWIRANTDQRDVLASGLDTMLYLYTGRQGIRPFEPKPMALFYGSGDEPIGSLDMFTRTLGHQSARFLVILPMPTFAEEPHLNRLVARVQQERPDCLHERYRNPRDSRFVVYEVRTAGCQL